MQIVRYRDVAGDIGVGVLTNSIVSRLDLPSISSLLRLSLADIRATVDQGGSRVDVATLLPPLDGRGEVWASGVTYESSREARVEESRQQSVYELVYDAARPELFFKSAAWRLVTDGDPVAIRPDSTLDVPEPELGLVVNSRGEIVGYLVCNDMSSRSIEGENPLYLPQAKIYAGACSVSAGITPAWLVDPTALSIVMTVTRGQRVVFDGATSTAALRRPLDELVDYLLRSENFPDGVVLSTGTGIVPATSFTLEVGDTVSIGIESVGTLTNHVVSGKSHFDHLPR